MLSDLTGMIRSDKDKGMLAYLQCAILELPAPFITHQWHGWVTSFSSGTFSMQKYAPHPVRVTDAEKVHSRKYQIDTASSGAKNN